MIDLHTHSLFSDGALIPSESAQRAWAAGYKTIAITDHSDCSNLDFILPRIIKACAANTGRTRILLLPVLAAQALIIRCRMKSRFEQSEGSVIGIEL